jgi:molybdate transport system substrate-binding protein
MTRRQISLCSGAVWLVIMMIAFWYSPGRLGAGEQITVYAAASLRDVLTEAARQFGLVHNGRVHFNFAGSNVLAQQLVAANEADIFVSANQYWMDHVVDHRRALSDSLRPLLSNQIVIVAHAKTDWTIDKPEDLADLPIRFLSIGDPLAVPAGQYAQGYLSGIPHEKGSLWEWFADRVAPAPDVRAALGLVESDPDIIGIVYLTDAIASDSVRVIYQIPQTAVAPINYFAVMIDRPEATPLTQSFYQFLFSPEATKVFSAYGFDPAPNRLPGS